MLVDIITKVALKQVIPPTCCEIGAESLERVGIPAPQHFMNLSLKNPDCIYTYENSHWATVSIAFIYFHAGEPKTGGCQYMELLGYEINLYVYCTITYM